MVNALDQDVPSRGRAIYVLCIVAPIITGVFVALRAYARVFITKKNFASDWICYVTLLWIAAFGGTLAQAPKYGMGRHVNDISPAMESGMYFWILVSSVFYVLSLWGYKASLLFLYLQLFGVYRRFRLIVYGVLFYTTAYLFCNLIVQVAGCQPIQKFWLPSTPGHCTDSVAQDIAFGVGHMTSDLLIAILPLPMIWRLHFRTTKEKFGLALVLGTGLIAWIVALVRFIFASIDLTSQDRTWIAGETFILSILEVNTGLICGCTPALKPLIMAAREHTSDWSRKHSISFPDWSRKRSLGYVFSRKASATMDADSERRGFVELDSFQRGHVARSNTDAKGLEIVVGAGASSDAAAEFGTGSKGSSTRGEVIPPPVPPKDGPVKWGRVAVDWNRGSSTQEREGNSQGPGDPLGP